ncbi:MAG: DUF6125 family protein [Bacillota bacterium]|nr:DUF6125 family protein [Bacillota bacterium]
MEVDQLSREQLFELLNDFAKRWLAHDGLWFQEVEKAYGMDEAIRLDAGAWEHFTVIEAQRIMKILNLEPGGGLPALKKALEYRLYAFINKQEIIQPDQNRLIFRMKDCRVQSARRLKEMPEFPCKPVGQVEYSGFAGTIDSRIKTKCLCCPPDEHPENYYCAWEFTI